MPDDGYVPLNDTCYMLLQEVCSSHLLVLMSPKCLLEKNKTNHNHYELSHNTRLSTSDLWCKAQTVLLHVAQCFHLVDKI